MGWARPGRASAAVGICAVLDRKLNMIVSLLYGSVAEGGALLRAPSLAQVSDSESSVLPAGADAAIERSARCRARPDRETSERKEPTTARDPRQNAATASQPASTIAQIWSERSSPAPNP